MFDQQLTRALVELILFIEMSDENAIDPDAAIAALEQLSATLKQANTATKQTLCDQMRALSRDFPDASEFVHGLPRALDLEH